MLTARQLRLDRRVPGPNGMWFAPDARRHGTGGARSYWGCACDPCLEYARQKVRASLANSAHNRKVLQSVKHEEPPTKTAHAEPALVLVKTHEPVSEPAPPSRPPPMTPAVRQMITSVAQLDDIRQAFETPQWTVVQPDGRKRQIFGTAEIVVPASGELIIGYHERDRNGTAASSTSKPRGLPKARGGGGGSTTPTSHREMMARVRAAGLDVEKTGSGHVRIVSPAGKKVIVPSTASDYRSIRNSWALLKKAFGMRSQ